MINLDQIKHIYFIGIGGIAMSAAAGLTKSLGYEVSGSDSKEIYSPAKDVLDKFSIPYVVGYEESNVRSSNADLFVVSAGEDMNNPEVAYLEQNDIEYHSFSELLGSLAEEKLRIVVAGTNGKSTTTGLLGHVMSEVDDSSFMAGAVLQQYGTNFHAGTGHYFIFEGDEYKALANDPTPKFHFYNPDILILTNLEYDHPDMYDSLEQIKDEFRLLISNLPDDALVVYNADDANLVQLIHETNAGAVSYGISNNADYKVENIQFNQNSTSFDVVNEKWTKPESYNIALAGQLNIYNAIGPIALLRALGFKQEQIHGPIQSYWGVKRRLELVGEKNGITIYDDYAHFPTAVKETLAAVRTRYAKSGTAKVFAVFEPHTYSRTSATLDQLAQSFVDADRVVIAEVYPARETRNDKSITGQEVVNEISKHHNNVSVVANKAEALDIIKKEAKPGDVIIVMAVGSFNTLAYDLLEQL